MKKDRSRMRDDTTDAIVFLPQPRLVELTGGTFVLPENGLVVIEGADEEDLRLPAESIITALRRANKTGWKFSGGAAAALDADPGSSQTGHPSTITLRLLPETTMHNEGYELSIAAGGIVATANTSAGIFYSAQTLVQIIQQAEQALPYLHIQDWPDFPNRGVMLDISRDKVPTMDTLF
jgi:hexosaminidase